MRVVGWVVVGRGVVVLAVAGGRGCGGGVCGGGWRALFPFCQYGVSRISPEIGYIETAGRQKIATAHALESGPGSASCAIQMFSLPCAGCA